jgi:hypothetical protein
VRTPQVTKDRLPVCLHFLRGLCVRDDCPYPHTRLPLAAEPCKVGIACSFFLFFV